MSLAISWRVRRSGGAERWWACVRNCAKKASEASTPEYDGKFGMKSLNGLGCGESLEGWAGTRSGGCRSKASKECRILLHEGVKGLALAGAR